MKDETERQEEGIRGWRREAGLMGNLEIAGVLKKTVKRNFECLQRIVAF
jgi:hypothetical protein